MTIQSAAFDFSDVGLEDFERFIGFLHEVIKADRQIIAIKARWSIKSYIEIDVLACIEFRSNWDGENYYLIFHRLPFSAI